jgi:Ca2+-binding EF-hand superfamily protein
VIAHKSSTEEILELRKAFDQYDCGHDGVITFEEFKSGLQKVNYDDDDMHEIFDSIDVNQNGCM